MKKSMRYIVLCSAIGLISAASCNNNNEPLKNLVTNGNAETPKYDSVPPGWINVQGHWISSEGDSARHDCTFAQNGKYLFFAGNDTLGILQQDVSVSDMPQISIKLNSNLYLAVMCNLSTRDQLQTNLKYFFLE